MISHRLQSAPIIGYYEYLSRIRHRVNVASHEGTDNEDIITQTTTTTASPSVTSVMDNDDNTASATNSFSADSSQEQSVDLNSKDVTQWSSTEVQHWVEEQCQKFELKKATTEKFQMNGQALVLLTKHDFLRRTPDGGEILYYALRRLINPNKSNSVRTGQNLTRNGSSRQNTRIVEVDSEIDEHNSVTGSSPSTKPIIEEPDDPPLHRTSDSETNHEPQQHQYYPHSFLHNHAHIHQPIFAMHNTAYYHPHQAFPNAFVYAHHHPHPHHQHVHAHIPQQQFFHAQPHAHFIHQYHPMMAAQGILIEALDNDEANNLTANGVSSALGDPPTNGTSTNAQEQLYLITMNGQRYVMNEQQIIQYVTQIQQQQQHFQQQQQHFHQQQQQQFHQQQHTYQPSQDNTFHTS